MPKLSVAALRAAGLGDAEIVQTLEAQERLDREHRLGLAAKRQARWRERHPEAALKPRPPRPKKKAQPVPRQQAQFDFGEGLAAEPVTEAGGSDGRKKARKPRSDCKTPWPGYDSCPPEWREATPDRSDPQIAYAFARFKNWVEQRDARFVGERGWKAAWRNCAGPTGWAFENRYRMNGHAVDRRQEFADALDTLAKAGRHVPGRPNGVSANGRAPDAPVQPAAGGERSEDLHHGDIDRDDILPF